MSLVNVHNEWDPLEEIIIGVPDNARVPIGEKGLFSIEYNEHHESVDQIPSGPYDPRIIEETKEDLAGLVETLEDLGVVVRRPNIVDHSRIFSSPDWQSDGEYNYCPRDILLTIGQTVIEAPMTLRSRFFETWGYKEILIDYFKSGARWISAPKPRLLDETYNDHPKAEAKINNFEPIFDAANVLRAGRDILYLVSCTGNMMGCEWLQRTLGDEYRVHPLTGIYDGTHIDTTITLLGPERVLLNPSRINSENMPELFKTWDVLWCPEMIDMGYSPTWDYPRASIWSGMNMFMINPKLAIVNETQEPLIEFLSEHGIDSIPMKLRNCLTLSGGFHCVSLDVRRRGVLEDYS